MDVLRLIPMKISSNKKYFFILIAAILAVGGFFVWKKNVFFQYPQKISIDVIEDNRGLGYTGQRKIVSDEEGNYYVAYRKKYEKQSEIFVTRFSREGKVSGTTKPIAIISEEDQRVPSIAIDSKGIVHIVWYGSDTEKEKNNRQIKYARSSDRGETWSSWRNITFVSGYSKGEDFWQEHPSILAGSNGMLYIVWEGKDEQNKRQQIKFSRSNNGGDSWSSWKNIRVTRNNTQSRPSLAEDGNGRLYVFMYSSQGDGNDVQKIQYAGSSDRGETWNDWQPISDQKFDARHASVAQDFSGNIHIVWRSPATKNGPSQIIYRSLSESRWSDAVVVSPSSSSQYQFFPSIGVRKIGDMETVFVVWMENDGLSGFPRDDPDAGYGFISFLSQGKFSAPARVGKGNILYPNIPERIDNTRRVPIVYEEMVEERKYGVMLGFY